MKNKTTASDEHPSIAYMTNRLLGLLEPKLTDFIAQSDRNTPRIQLVQHTVKLLGELPSEVQQTDIASMVAVAVCEKVLRRMGRRGFPTLKQVELWPDAEHLKHELEGHVHVRDDQSFTPMGKMLGPDWVEHKQQEWDRARSAMERAAGANEWEDALKPYLTAGMNTEGAMIEWWREHRQVKSASEVDIFDSL